MHWSIWVVVDVAWLAAAVATAAAVITAMRFYVDRRYRR